MTETEIAVLLALANGHDQRQGTDDVKVQSWYSLFRQEAPRMTFEWAMERVNRHYATSTDMLMPAHLIAAWRYDEERATHRRALRAAGGVPMPEWFPRKIAR